MDIAGQTQHISIVLNKDALEASLEEMPAMVVGDIKCSRIAGSQPLHGLREIGFQRLEQNVVMISHQYIGEYFDVKPL
jgi:hypothetical protein